MPLQYEVSDVGPFMGGDRPFTDRMGSVTPTSFPGATTINDSGGYAPATSKTLAPPSDNTPIQPIDPNKNTFPGGLPTRPPLSSNFFGARSVRPLNEKQNKNFGDSGWRQNLATFGGGGFTPTRTDSQGGATELDPLAHAPFGAAGPPMTLLDRALSEAAPYDPFGAATTPDYLSGLGNPLQSLFSTTGTSGQSTQNPFMSGFFL